MTNKPDKDFGKRRPASVATVPRQGPPAKRSGHVALLLMGTLAVGSTAYTLMPRDNCQRPPDVPSPSLLQGSSTKGFHVFFNWTWSYTPPAEIWPPAENLHKIATHGDPFLCDPI